MTTAPNINKTTTDFPAFRDIVSANVRAQCALRGMNQRDLARATGWSYQMVNLRWINKRQWQLEDLQVVADYFGIQPWQLCTPMETGKGDTPQSAALYSLPQLDSNQQPFDYCDGPGSSGAVGANRDEVRQATIHSMDDFRHRKADNVPVYRTPLSSGSRRKSNHDAPSDAMYEIG